MWGVACLMTWLILNGTFRHLYLAECYSYHYINRYIIWFTGASLIGFWLAHRFKSGDEVNLYFDHDFLESALQKYRWIMWLNFFGGILRIILMINIVGMNSVMDYRMAANEMMNTGSGPVGMVFRITNYIQMLANFYVALSGFKAGFGTLNFKDVVGLFILYAPTQMATGGRLFILYFILFYIGSFLLGRGLVLKGKERNLLEKEEKMILGIVSIGMLALVSFIAMARGASSEGTDDESAIAKFTYISEGMLESEHYMRFDPPETHKIDGGVHFVTGKSNDYLQFRGFLQMSRMSSIVISVITPLYTSFGFWGSIIVWGLMCLFLETIAIGCLRKMTVIRFLIYLTILKIMYETVITNPIPGNIAVYELILLFVVFYKPIFGTIENENQKMA